MPRYSIASKLLAEFVGTFFLVAAGVGVFVSTGGEPGLVAVALAHGLAIATVVTAVGHVSGAHFNPAVTVAMLAFRKLNPVEGVAYIVTQLVAGYAACLVLWQGFSVDASTFAGSVPALGDGLGMWNGILLEAVATFVLVFVIFGVAVDVDGAYAKVAGLPIGFAVMVGILMIGPVTGAALNPARWFGPAALTTSWDDAVVWIAGPIVGALLAGGLHLYGIRPRLSAATIEPDGRG